MEEEQEEVSLLDYKDQISFFMSWYFSADRSNFTVIEYGENEINGFFDFLSSLGFEILDEFFTPRGIHFAIDEKDHHHIISVSSSMKVRGSFDLGVCSVSRNKIDMESTKEILLLELFEMLKQTTECL